MYHFSMNAFLKGPIWLSKQCAQQRVFWEGKSTYTIGSRHRQNKHMPRAAFYPWLFFYPKKINCSILFHYLQILSKNSWCNVQKNGSKREMEWGWGGREVKNLFALHRKKKKQKQSQCCPYIYATRLNIRSLTAVVMEIRLQRSVEWSSLSVFQRIIQLENGKRNRKFGRSGWRKCHILATTTSPDNWKCTYLLGYGYVGARTDTTQQTNVRLGIQCRNVWLHLTFWHRSFTFKF